MKLIMTLGLPASGKSTWAKEEVLKSNGRTKRINKDDLRAMFDAGQWSKQNEKLIVAARNELICLALSNGKDVIVDDTNFGPHEADLQAIADDYEAEFVVKDFTDVPLQTCIDRDSARGEKSVGEDVIKRMYNSFLKKKGHVAQYQKPPFKEGFPYCIIVDIDGTLAHMDGRSPYDYSKVNTDIVDENVRDIVWRYAGSRSVMDEVPDTYVIIVSGRESGCRNETIDWLTANHIPFDEFYMRDAGDFRDDRIVKKEIYDKWVEPRFNVRFVLDDRDRVVKMWREQGLKVLQVAEGDF